MACKPKEDHDAKEATYPRRDRVQAAPGRCAGRTANPAADAIRTIGVTEVTYDRWRQEYGGLKSSQVKRMKELETENAACASHRRPHARQADPAGGGPETLSPAHRRTCVEHIRLVLTISERRACRALGRTAQHNAKRRGAKKTKSGSPPISSSWRVSTAATAIARSRPCYGTRAGL